MKLPLYQVDAFTTQVFGGNPAAVCPLEEWLPDERLQQIAAENNLSETAFYVPERDFFGLRWFTPTTEVDLCGHATLAAAFVLFQLYEYDAEEIRFATRSGVLTVKKAGERLVMDFPTDTILPAELPAPLKEGLGGISPVATFRGKADYLVVLESQSQVAALQPDFRKLKEDTTYRGIIVTAPGGASPEEEGDFVSRFFGPGAGIDEDPVTGSAHTTLTPYWADRLGKHELVAHQISDRRGTLYCTLQGERTIIAGEAALYLRGEIEVNP